jgi:fatty acid desaturase
MWSPNDISSGLQRSRAARVIESNYSQAYSKWSTVFLITVIAALPGGTIAVWEYVLPLFILSCWRLAVCYHRVFGINYESAVDGGNQWQIAG